MAISVFTEHAVILAEMQDLRKRQNRPRLLLSFVLRAMVGLCLFVVLVFVGRAAWGMYQKFSVASNSREGAELELAELQAQERQVSASVAEFKSERGVEGKLRERYGVARAGEGEITIMRDQNTEDASAYAGDGFWASLWDALFVW